MDIRRKLTQELDEAVKHEKLAGRNEREARTPESNRIYLDARRATNVAREALEAYIAKGARR